MLDRIREGSQGPIVRVILFLIIVAFAFTGVSAYLGGGASDYVAKVNDQEITRAAFERQYQNQRSMMEQQFGDMFNLLAADENYMRQMRRDVLEQMIEEQLAIELAGKIGIKQSSQVLREQIRQMPEFQVGGQFDNNLYLRLLNNAGYTPEMFRDYLQAEMSRIMMLQGVLGSEFALPHEIERMQMLQNERRSGRFATISVERFADQVEVTDEAVENFYFDNQEQFRQEERIRLAYVALDFNDVVATIDVSDSEVRAYYDDNPAVFASEELRSIAHILVEFGDDEDAAYARIQGIQARLEEGEDFADLAAAESDDMFSGEDGGELGRLERDSFDPDLEDAGFALAEEGDVSGIVRSEFGFHLVKLTELVPAETTSFADVEADIRRNIAQAEAERVYFELQQQLARLTFEYPDTLEVAAEELGLTIQTSPWIRRAQAPEGYDDPRLLAEAFSDDVRELDMNSELVELDRRSLVVRADDYESARIRDLAEVRNDIYAYLAEQQAERLAKEYAESLLAQLQAGEAITDENVAFRAIEAAPRFGGELPGAVRQQLFRMAHSDSATYAAVTLANGDAAIIELTHVMPGVPDAAEQQRFGRQIEGQRSELAYQALMEGLKSKAKIERRL
ncbi:peptidylprolyl isomerase [Aliidiomarina halalkaliphila]|uniref:Periplasmic chaperone PpiD n=1 Tax=Aliidiomarina halalkaliphila TaxID=2593535 RepID=A0A552X2V9_9GAMM|nr:SurA N-terminal domain-containing protein [Aliidiomarina halalkaliphila]TRW49364.1 peptidylprolyl isomerase [Aliidiomarina halalkaliphila]